MNPYKAWWIEERMKKAVEKLKAHEFDALYVMTREEAVKETWRHIKPEMTVGVGGSITIRELGIVDQLKANGNKVYDHWVPGISRADSTEIRKSQITSDLFLSSTNAVTLSGELINIDGTGNRTNGMVFGPGKVILIAGYNKIAEDVQEAIKMIKQVSAPINARRLNLDLPCAKVGRCVDCNSPNRICRVVVIHERKPLWTDMLVILVGEDLGL